jgi:hypothetical protein
LKLTDVSMQNKYKQGDLFLVTSTRYCGPRTGMYLHKDDIVVCLEFNDNESGNETLFLISHLGPTATSLPKGPMLGFWLKQIS